MASYNYHIPGAMLTPQQYNRSYTSTHTCYGIARAVLFYQKAGVEGSLASTASAKRANSLGPVERNVTASVLPLSLDGKVVVVVVVEFHCARALSILDYSEPTRYHTRICPTLFASRASSTPTSASAMVSASLCL